MSTLSPKLFGTGLKSRRTAYAYITAVLKEDFSVWENREDDFFLTLGGTDASWACWDYQKHSLILPSDIVRLLIQEIRQTTRTGHNRKAFIIIETFENHHPQAKQNQRRM